MGATPEVYVQGEAVQAPAPRTYPFSSVVQEVRGEPVTVTPPAAATVVLAVPGAAIADEIFQVILTGFYRGATRQGVISGLGTIARLAAAAATGTFVGGLVAATGAAVVAPVTLVPTVDGFDVSIDAAALAEAIEVQCFAHVCRQQG